MNSLEMLVQKKEGETARDACERAGEKILTGYIFIGYESWLFEDPDDICIGFEGQNDRDELLAIGEGWNDMIQREAENAIEDLKLNGNKALFLRDGRAIMALGDGITWGSDFAVVDDKTEAKVMLTEKDKKNIMDHPEMWVDATLYYCD